MANGLRNKKKAKRGKKNNAHQHEIQLKDGEQQVYAQVTTMLGSCRLMAFCYDGITRMCRIRGKLYKSEWIKVGDIVLVGLRSYQAYRADVLLKYTSQEVRILKKNGSIPESSIFEKDADVDDNVEIVFRDTPVDENAGKENREHNLPNFEESESDKADDDQLADSIQFKLCIENL